MPVINNQEEWDAWKEKNKIQKVMGYETFFEVHIAGKPEQFPCWLVAKYQTGDCRDDYWECTFIYQDAHAQWNLEKYETEEGWGNW